MTRHSTGYSAKTPHWLKAIHAHTLEGNSTELRITPDSEVTKIRVGCKSYGYAAIQDGKLNNSFLVVNANGFRMALQSYLNHYMSSTVKDRSNTIRRNFLSDEQKEAAVERAMGMYSGSCNIPTLFGFTVKKDKGQAIIATTYRTPLTTMQKILEAIESY